MANYPFVFSTGSTQLPDIGACAYNGCAFSPLFESSISGTVVRDNAQRTTKLMEYTITVDGYVTLGADNTDTIKSAVDVMRDRLQAQGGSLVYQGRGFDLLVNAGQGASTHFDVAWGPVPKLIEFQSLGGSQAAGNALSAKVKWSVTTRVCEIKRALNPKMAAFGRDFLQFNSESSVEYGLDGYSTLSIRGTMEIPLTRTPLQTTRTVETTVDAFRSEIQDRVLRGIDLDRFQLTRRQFNVSRDKRTMEWSVVAEERPYMSVPPDCTVARGNYSVRPAKAGMGLVLWLCTLRATYTVRADKPRRIAWAAFLALLRNRMSASERADLTGVDRGGQPRRGPVDRLKNLSPAYRLGQEAMRYWQQLNNTQKEKVKKSRNAWLIDFSFDEGLYLDSKTTSFSATWRLVTNFSHILLASGLWRKVAETDAGGNNIWAASMSDIQGVNSWLVNKVDPKLDIIVDFGGG